MRVDFAYQIGDSQSRLSKCQRFLEIPGILHLGNDTEHGGDTSVCEDQGADGSHTRVERWVVEQLEVWFPRFIGGSGGGPILNTHSDGQG